MTVRRATALLGTAALAATPFAIATAAPSAAADREFRCGIAKVEFDVERDDGRFGVEADLDTRPGAAFRVVLKQDGRTYLNRVFRADGDGDVEIERNRPNTPGRDVFRITVKKAGGGATCSRVVTFRR